MLPRNITNTVQHINNKHPCSFLTMLLILQSLTFYLISVITAILIGLYFYVTRNFKIWQQPGVPYVKPDTAVQNIQGRTLFEIPWLWIILSHTALKNPALSHRYCSEKELYKSITLSNLTFVWRFSGEQYFWKTFRLFSKGKFTTAYRKQNRHIKATLQIYIDFHREILQTLYNPLTTNTPVPS